MMPHPANDYFCVLDERAGRMRQPGHAIFAYADDFKPVAAHDASPLAIALIAAAAIALPPRLPASVMYSSPRGEVASSSLASAAPTKPTGKASSRAGRGPLLSIFSSRRK